MGKFAFFLTNADLLSRELGIVPLLYGSLGLAYRTGEDLTPEDIDVLIPGVFLKECWEELAELLAQQGYRLTDPKEHTFEKDGIHYSYAEIEELEAFAGISLPDIPVVQAQGVSFRLLTLPQYLQVYTASSMDGYRVDVRGKKDAEKIALIRRLLQDG